MTIIGLLASEPTKWFLRNRKQMYSCTFHVEQRGHTECIKVVAEENAIIGMKRGHKYMCRGRLVSRNIKEKKVVYLDADLILSSDAEDMNEIEVTGTIEKRDKIIRRNPNGHEHYHFFVHIESEWDSWIDVDTNNTTADIAFKYPLGAKVSIKGKLQSYHKMRDGAIISRYSVIPYRITGCLE